MRIPRRHAPDLAELEAAARTFDVAAILLTAVAGVSELDDEPRRDLP